MKKMKGKDGGVLVMVMVVMLAFSVLAIGLFKLRDTDTLETVYVKHTAQAFWVAEAGLQRTLDKLRSNKAYREGVAAISFDEASATEETDMVGNGSYVAAVWYNTSLSNFVIQSRGTVMDGERLLRLEAGLSDFGTYGLVTLDGDSKIFKDATIDGSIYQNGKLRVSGGVNITGDVLADNHDDFASGSSIPEDGVLELSIDTSFFDIDLVRPTTGATIITNTLNLAGGIVVVDSSIDKFTNRIIGGGTLVVKSGGQSFKNGLFVDPYTTIIVVGDLTIEKNATFGENVVLFSTGGMDLFKSATADVVTGTGCAFLTLGDMKIKKELTFDGLIFSEGSITADKDLDVSGTIITQDGFTLKKDATVTFDPAVISDDVRNNMIVSTFFVQSSIWNELPAN